MYYAQVIETPTQKQAEALAGLSGITYVLIALWWLWTQMVGWESLDRPYNIIAAFYYLTIALPIMSFGGVWSLLEQTTFTAYPNLNAVLAVVCFLTYCYLFKRGLKLLFVGLAKIGITKKRFFSFMAMPGMFALIYLVVTSTTTWLMSA